MKWQGLKPPVITPEEEETARQLKEFYEGINIEELENADRISSQNSSEETS